MTAVAVHWLGPGHAGDQDIETGHGGAAPTVPGTEPAAPQTGATCLDEAVRKLRAPLGPLSKGQDIAVFAAAGGLTGGALTGFGLAYTSILDPVSAGLVGFSAASLAGFVAAVTRSDCLETGPTAPTAP